MTRSSYGYGGRPTGRINPATVWDNDRLFNLEEPIDTGFGSFTEQYVYPGQEGCLPTQEFKRGIGALAVIAQNSEGQNIMFVIGRAVPESSHERYRIDGFYVGGQKKPAGSREFSRESLPGKLAPGMNLPIRDGTYQIESVTGFVNLRGVDEQV